MDNATQIKVRQIVKDNAIEVLKQYLTKDLYIKFTNEILAGVEWDLGNMEEE